MTKEDEAIPIVSTSDKYEKWNILQLTDSKAGVFENYEFTDDPKDEDRKHIIMQIKFPDPPPHHRTAMEYRLPRGMDWDEFWELPPTDMLEYRSIVFVKLSRWERFYNWYRRRRPKTFTWKADEL